MRPLLSSTTLVAGEALWLPADEISYVYFPAGAVVSLLAVDKDGKTFETAAIGRDGAVGVAALAGVRHSPLWPRVQRSGPALRASTSRLREALRDCPALAERLWRFTHVQAEAAAQSAVCARFHHLDRQLCSWLLATADAWESDEIEATHEAIAERLGTRRASITVALGELGARGLVERRRGRIAIVDRAPLAEAACECYGLVREAYGRLHDGPPDAEAARAGASRGGRP